MVGEDSKSDEAPAERVTVESRDDGASDARLCSSMFRASRMRRTHKGAAPVPNQAAFDFSSSRMMRRSVSSNRGAFQSRYSRSAALMRVW